MSSGRKVELELLLAAASVEPNAARCRRIELALGQAPDWASLRTAAHAHGMVPLLARALEGRALDPAGADAREQLRGEARSIALRSVYRSAELVRLLRLFANAGVPALTYKGPALAVAAYGAVEARTWSDLDLLVRWRDFPAARDLLGQEGYEPLRDEFSKVRQRSHELTFDSRGRRVQVDLHRRLFSHELPSIAFESLWQSREMIKLGGCEVATIGSDTLLLVLCEHAHKHGWSRVAWISDLGHLLAKSPTLDWDRLITRASQLGIRRMLSIGLLLAHRLTGAEVPGGTLTTLSADPVANALAQEIEWSLLSRRAPVSADDWLELSDLRWRGTERWRDRLRFALTPNESDWKVLPLPGAPWPIYYVIRPLRLLLSYGLRRTRRFLSLALGRTRREPQPAER